jgi:hypothetical protein
MTPAEIITADSEKRGLDANQVLSNIAVLLKKHDATLLHHGNTLLLLRGIGKNNVELHLFTQERSFALLKALKVFIKNIRHSKIDKVYGQADNKGILAFLKKLDVEVLPSDLPQYNWMAKV